MSEFVEKMRKMRKQCWESEPKEIGELTDTAVGYTDTWDSPFFPILFGWGETIASRNVLHALRKTLLEDEVDFESAKRITSNLVGMYVPFLKWANLPETTDLFREASEEILKIDSKEEAIELLGEMVLYTGRLNYRIEPIMPWPELIKTFNEKKHA